MIDLALFICVSSWHPGWYGKGHCINLYSSTSDKLFYEANKQIEIIKWLYMEG
jgi:hypothetical protein